MPVIDIRFHFISFYKSPPNFLDTGAISSLPSIKVTENEEAETKQDEEWNNDTHLVDITAQEVRIIIGNIYIDDNQQLIFDDHWLFIFAASGTSRSLRPNFRKQI